MVLKEGFKKRVGRYYLGRTLGEGTYAKVKYGQHVDTGQPVAIKVLDKAQVVKGEMVEQIQREITIMRNLNHPNIVNLIEVMSSKDKIYIVMELVTGGELFDKIAMEGALKDDQARKIFQQLLDGLEYCHQQGVYHRDLKPENVLLTADGDAKLSDFGLGALQSHTRYDGLFLTTCGTPNYVAPEVLRKRGYEGGPADMWSLGVVLYVMLAGCLPFEEPDMASLFRKITSGEYASPPWFTQEHQTLLRKMLQPNPADRSSVEELRRDPWVAHGFPARPVVRSASTDSLVSEDILKETVNAQDVTQEEAERLLASRSSGKRLNAFELINSALDISAIFEHKDDVVTRRTRFTTKADAPAVWKALERAVLSKKGTAELKQATVEFKSGSMRLRLMGRQAFPLVVDVTIQQMLPGLNMVELAKYKGHSTEFYGFYRWLTTSALADIITKREGQV